MAKTPYLRDNDEEIVNALLHAVGLGLSLAGTAALVSLCADKSAAYWISSLCFSISLCFTYLMSTLYHGTIHPGKKRRWRMWDHISIYAAIAGGWSPMFLICTKSSLGPALFVMMWILALFGTYYKFRYLGKHEIVSLIGYLLMGWIGFLPILSGLTVIPDGAGIWFLVGGLFYTGGTYFYYSDFKPYFHCVWHIAVMLGGLCHFVGVYAYVLS